MQGTLLAGEPDAAFHGITTDSRKVNKGNLFVALRGDKYDGHDFVLAAHERGAAGSLVHDEAKIKGAAEYKGMAIIRVADTLKAFGDLAQDYRKSFTIPVIGLTGHRARRRQKK